MPIVKRSGAYVSCLRERRAPGGSQRFLTCSAGLETQRAVSWWRELVVEGCGMQEGIADVMEILPFL